MKQPPQHNQHGSKAGVGQPQRTLQPRDERGDGLSSPLLQMESEREDKDKTFSKSCRDISLCLCVHIYISAEWESNKWGSSSDSLKLAENTEHRTKKKKQVNCEAQVFQHKQLQKQEQTFIFSIQTKKN